MASRLKQIPESLLVTLWKEKAARQRSLRARNGRRFRVIYPGRQGTTAGPDFRDAVLEEEGVGLIRGDVEVHVRQRDWEVHGHSDDPRYNGVVLHVVAQLDDAQSTLLQSGTRVPVVSLEPLLHGPMLSGKRPGLWPLLRAYGYDSPADTAQMGVLLDKAGDSRFIEQSDAFLAYLGEEDPEQVLYAALMEALGYSQNRGPFLELAGRIPYRRLTKVANYSPPGERLALIQGLLLSAAGFWTSWAGNNGKGWCNWHLFRVRPQNHPRRRLIGFTYFLNLFLPPDGGPRSAPVRGVDNISRPSDGKEHETRIPRRQTGTPCPPMVARMDGDNPPPWANAGLVEGMARLVGCSDGKSGDRGCWRSLENALMGVGRPAAGRTTLEENRGLIGKARARDMAVNCVLPFLHAIGRVRGDSRLAQIAFRLYQDSPRLQDNELTREMRQQLFSHIFTKAAVGSGVSGYGNERVLEEVIHNARRQQGLLHLHRLITSPGSLSSNSAGQEISP